MKSTSETHDKIYTLLRSIILISFHIPKVWKMKNFFSSTKSENLRRVLVLFLSTDWIGVGYLKTRNTLDKSINIRFVMYIALFMDIFFCDVSIPS